MNSKSPVVIVTKTYLHSYNTRHSYCYFVFLFNNNINCISFGIFHVVPTVSHFQNIGFISFMFRTNSVVVEVTYSFSAIIIYLSHFPPPKIFALNRKIKFEKKTTNRKILTKNESREFFTVYFVYI